jgi:hypothetical protein
MNHSQILIRDYLNSKLQQAQREMELMTILINELDEILNEQKKNKQENTFLKLVSQKES